MLRGIAGITRYAQYHASASSRTTALLLYYYHYCSTTTTTQTYIEVYTPIAGYSPGGNVVEHNEVTLDQKP